MGCGEAEVEPDGEDAAGDCGTGIAGLKGGGLCLYCCVCCCECCFYCAFRACCACF